MRRLSLVAVLVCATGLLAACQSSISGKAAPGTTPNAVAGGEIEVTELGPLPGDAAAVRAGPEAEPAGTDTAAPQAAPAATGVEPEKEPVADAAEPAPKPDLAATPVTPKSEMQVACEKKRGRWAKVGNGQARACVFQTKDAGKRCERESQCDCVCLARSGTCAPFKPMYGCNEILQDNGMRVTLCLD